MKKVFVQEKDFQKARKKIKENKNREIIFSSNDDELSRKILEKEKVEILLINLARRKDKMKQRESGLNQVMAKLANKNNIAIGINFDEIANSKPKEKAEILARVRQNIMLCNKNKVEMRFVSKERKDKHDLKALGIVLGMPTWMAKDSVKDF